MKSEPNGQTAVTAPGVEVGVGVSPRSASAADAPAAQEAAGFFASLIGRMCLHWSDEREARPDPSDAAATHSGVACRPADKPVDAPAPALALPAEPPAPPKALQRQPSRHAAAEPVGALAQRAPVASAGPLSAKEQEIIEHLATSVRDFCNDPTTQGREGWTVRLQLNPALLPRTSLEMDLTPQWLLLRFYARDPGSRELISQGTEQLQSTLSDVVNPKRDVLVSVE